MVEKVKERVEKESDYLKEKSKLSGIIHLLSFEYFSILFNFLALSNKYKALEK